MALYYVVDKTKLYALIEEEVSKVADEAYAEGGQSLYDSIILTEKDRSTVERFMEDALNAFVAREDGISAYSPLVETDENENEVVTPRLEVNLPDFDLSRWNAAQSELDRYVTLSVCSGIFQSRRAEKVEEYSARALAAMEKVLSLLKTRIKKQNIPEIATEINSESTHKNAASAKAVYDFAQPREGGKGLSTNDYTDEDKELVGRIPNYPTKIYVDSALRLEADGRMLSDNQLSSRITKIETVVPSTATPSNSLTTVNWVNTRLNKKQDTLVSGDNIKTINGQTLLGGGDIPVAKIFYLNAYFIEIEEGHFQYDHGDVTKAKLDEIINAGNIPYLNVYIKGSDAEEYDQAAVSVFDGSIGGSTIYSFRMGYGLIFDVYITFLFENDQFDVYISLMYFVMTDLINSTIEDATPSNDEIDALFTE